VRRGPDGFLVSFAQAHGPYIVNATAEDLQREGVAARVIARLLIPPNRMREFAEIFNNMVEQLARDAEESSNDTESGTNDTRDTG